MWPIPPPKPVYCGMYEQRIIALKKLEKSLVSQANRTDKKGILMEISVKYRHVDNRLRGELQDQRACFYENQTIKNMDKHWKSYDPTYTPKPK